LAVLRRATASIAASRFVADDLSVPSVVVPNCYDDSLFRILGAPERRGDLLFVGRLVSDKGVSVLVDAVRRLVASGTNPSLTIVGAGPEEPALRAQAAALGIGPRVRFAGALSGEALVEEYNRHRYVVVPSVWEEPFGIVALEAIACGCIPVVSDGGGLPEAAGNCGVVFRRGDSTSLADVLAGLESDGARREALALGRPAHLERHRRDVMSRAYREVLVNACGRSRVAEAP
jgi:glycosyltransferase involved in cell wall biosynthesis